MLVLVTGPVEGRAQPLGGCRQSVGLSERTRGSQNAPGDEGNISLKRDSFPFTSFEERAVKCGLGETASPLTGAC